MEFSDWLLAFHLLAAFALIASLVLFTALMIATWGDGRPQRAVAFFRIAAIGGPLIGLGAGLTLVLGIWLAIDLDAYEPWDGWIISAFVLWAIGGFTGSRVGAHYTAAQELAERLAPEGDEPNTELAGRMSDQRIRTLHAVSVLAFVAVLVLMIFKPGA